MPAPTIDIDDAAAELFTGYGTEAAVARMMSGTLSMRIILLRTLIAEIASDRPEADDAAGLSAAYGRLLELQRSHPETVQALLAYPHTGVWLSRVLHRARAEGGDSAAVQAIPLWADLGYLGWLAAAGTMASSAGGSLRVVVRDGVVMLPGIGLARVGAVGEFGHRELRWEDGSIEFGTEAGELIRVAFPVHESGVAWRPLRRLRPGSGEPEVLFDELDPFRYLHSDPPAPLATDEIDTWRTAFADAWRLLRHDHPRYLTPMRGCLRMITPLTARPVAASTSHTAYHGVGCVYTTAPADPCTLAMSLIHEIQHSKFAMLTDQVLLFDNDETCRFYAPWRDDPRPILGLLHGIYAFFGVTDFWRVHRYADCHRSMLSHTEFELWRRQLAVAIAQAQGSGLLTATGARLAATLSAGAEPWSREEVPDQARRAASEIMTAHRTFWQVRNRSVRDADLVELTERWLARTAPGIVLPPARDVDQSTIPERHRRLHLSAQLKLNDPAAARTIARPDQPRGDHAYLAGEWSAAVEMYALELAIDPLRPQLWAGLAAALPKAFPGNTFEILEYRAEVAAGLLRRVQEVDGATDVVELVRWLSPPSPTTVRPGTTAPSNR
ncbi:HEXXH motif domain-containing protein [Nocardia acidivorans]|uniref:HEXXH motif domain-containing protein n=1 Tax=Nocardia acidivorans TaxID=404580 RepID=UPI000837354E|nr:HEXXH motif domain-containing protein [Nocardia acidivorans]